jgi:hypothetical protein
VHVMEMPLSGHGQQRGAMASCRLQQLTDSFSPLLAVHARVMGVACCFRELGRAVVASKGYRDGVERI